MVNVYFSIRDNFYGILRKAGDLALFDSCDNHHYKKVEVTGSFKDLDLHPEDPNPAEMLAWDKDLSQVLYRTKRRKKFLLLQVENDRPLISSIEAIDAELVFRKLELKKYVFDQIFAPWRLKQIEEENNKKALARLTEEQEMEALQEELGPYGYILEPGLYD